MPAFYEPENWYGLAGLVLIVSAVVIPAWLSYRSHRGMKGDMREVKDEVKNNHDTNLRDDIDGIRNSVDALVILFASLETRFDDHIRKGR